MLNTNFSLKYDKVINLGSRTIDEQTYKVLEEKRKNEVVIMEHGKENLLKNNPEN